jgi:hypothetical protein
VKFVLQHQNVSGGKGSATSALPHIPEAVTGFLQMVFGVLVCQLATQSLRAASYRPKTMNALLREGYSM